MRNIFKAATCLLLAVAVVLCFLPVKIRAVSTSAKSHILINADTLEVLDSNNSHLRLSMASTTKIMTALILAEQNTPDKTIVTTKKMVTVEGSSMGLLEGDTVSYYALLVGMLLSSGNDAANTTAIAIAGSTDKFAELMNKKAAQIGMTNTHFVTPSGLDDEEHYSTAYDMALLAAYALKNETIRSIVCQKSITVSYGNPPYKRTLTNHNKLLSMYDKCIGVKTGFTKKSGRCLVSAASDNGCTVIAVTLNDKDDWDDHINLLEYGLSKLTPKDVSYKFDIDTVNVVGANTLGARVSAERLVIGLDKSNSSNIKAELFLKPFIYAPVRPGTVVGYVEYSLDGIAIAKFDVYTVADLEFEQEKKRTFYENIFIKIKNILLHIS